MVDLRVFKQRVRRHETAFRRFLSRLARKPPTGLARMAKAIDREVWKEVDCLKCGNCCRVMTPTYTRRDIRRISRHLAMTARDFKRQWLRRERGSGDWINRLTPCQFLDLASNRCAIYAIRPEDCTSFPHLRKNTIDQVQVHKQNLALCPATYLMVEKMMARTADATTGTSVSAGSESPRARTGR
jgi:Fe-S-cluster containining protein